MEKEDQADGHTPQSDGADTPPASTHEPRPDPASLAVETASDSTPSAESVEPKLDPSEPASIAASPEVNDASVSEESISAGLAEPTPPLPDDTPGVPEPFDVFAEPEHVADTQPSPAVALFDAEPGFDFVPGISDTQPVKPLAPGALPPVELGLTPDSSTNTAAAAGQGTGASHWIAPVIGIASAVALTALVLFVTLGAGRLRAGLPRLEAGPPPILPPAATAIPAPPPTDAPAIDDAPDASGNAPPVSATQAVSEAGDTFGGTLGGPLSSPVTDAPAGGQVIGMKRVFLVPIGAFPIGELDELANYYRGRYNTPIQVLPPLQTPQSAFSSSRNQWSAEQIKVAMQTSLAGLSSDSGTLLIGVMTEDIYSESASRQFTLGVRDDAHHIAIASVARLTTDTNQPAELRGERLRKLVTQYIGVMFYRQPLSADPASPFYSLINDATDLDKMEDGF